MHRFVRQHGFTDQIAYRKDTVVGHPLVLVHHHKLLVTQLHARLVESKILRVGPATNGYQDAREALPVLVDLTLQRHLDAVIVFLQGRHLGLEMHGLEAPFRRFHEGLHQVSIDARQQAIGQLHDSQPTPECGIDRAEIEADIASPYHQQGFRNLSQGQRCGGVHDAATGFERHAR